MRRPGRLRAVAALSLATIGIALTAAGAVGQATTTTTTTTTTPTPTADRCLGDLVQVDLPNGAVECRRPTGELVCMMPSPIFGTCPPTLPDELTRPPTTTGGDPPGGVVAVSTGTTDPVLSVSPGPSESVFFGPPCNDVMLGVEQQTSFVLTRTGATGSPLTLSYTVSGTGEAGVHYEPLPGTATVAAGQSSTVVAVTPLTTPRGNVVDLTLQLQPDPAYGVGDPASAQIHFVSPAEPGPHECGYSFTDDPWNTTQTVAVGEALHALSLEQFTPPIIQPAPGVFRALDGALPLGVELRADGSFGGAANAPGVFEATIEACRAEPPGTCVRTVLVVTVTGPAGTGTTAAVGTLPVTGPTPAATGPAGGVAVALLASLTLAAALVASRPRRRPA